MLECVRKTSAWFYLSNFHSQESIITSFSSIVPADPQGHGEIEVPDNRRGKAWLTSMASSPEKKALAVNYCGGAT